MRPMFRVGLVGAVLSLIVGAGVAVGFSPSDGYGPVVSAADCPEATAELESAGVHFDTYAPGCPSAEQVQEMIDASTSSHVRYTPDGDIAKPVESISADKCDPRAIKILEQIGGDRITTIDRCLSVEEAQAQVDELRANLPWMFNDKEGVAR